MTNVSLWRHYGLLERNVSKYVEIACIVINQRFSWVSLNVYLLTFKLTSVNVLVSVGKHRIHLR